jgi:hypothetical protein
MTELRRIAGKEARDCGRVGLGASTLETDVCVRDAFSRGKAFYARYERQGEDSKVSLGTVGTAEREVLFLHYDSAPCGGPGCNPAINEILCRNPSLLDADDARPPGDPPITCTSWDPTGRRCQ